MTDLLDWGEATAARDAGIAKHSEKDAGREWLLRAREAARVISQRRGSVNVNDVREAIGGPPAECNPTIMGAIFRTKSFAFIRYESNPRVKCHKRPIARFEYVGEAS